MRINTRAVTLSLTLLLLATAQTARAQADGEAQAVLTFAGQLKDENAQVRALAAERLVSLGGEAKAAIPALVEALRDSDRKVRNHSVVALGHLWWYWGARGPEAETAVPALIELLLKDDDRYTRREAAYALARIGQRAKAAIPALTQALNDREETVRKYAGYALNDIGKADPLDVPTLVSRFKDKDVQVREEAAERLLSQDEEVRRAALPALLEGIKDSNRKVRINSVMALNNLFGRERGPEVEAVVRAMMELLKRDADDGVRWSAVNVLDDIGPEARAAVPLLIEALGEEESRNRCSAARALGQIGSDSKEAAPTLIKMLKDPDAEVRYSAAIALGQIGIGKDDAISVLLDDLKSDDYGVRSQAAYGLQTFGPAAGAGAPLLAGMLRETEPSSRYRAASALGEIGPAAKTTVPALLRSLNDSAEYVRVAAAVALLKIAPESESKITPALLEKARARIAAVEKARAQGADRGSEGGFGGIAPRRRSDEAGEILMDGDNFYRRGDREAAIASYTKAIEVNPHYAEAYYSRGIVRRAKGDYDAALADLTKAIELAARVPNKYYYVRGAIQVSRREYDAAIADLTKVINRDAYSAEVYYARGFAHHWKGNYDAAIADYDRAIEIFPPVTLAFGVRGRARLSQGKIADALTDFDEAIKAAPKKAVYHQDRGDALKALGNLKNAEDSYREALRLAPRDPVVLNHLGYFLVEQNRNLNEALELIQRAAEARPANPVFTHSLGWAHFKLDHLEEAARYLSESVRLDGTSALTQEHLGDVYARRGDTRQARAAWSKALSLASEEGAKARLKVKLNDAMKE